MIPIPFEVTCCGNARFRCGSDMTLEIDPVKKPAIAPNTVEAMILLPPLLSHRCGAYGDVHFRCVCVCVCVCVCIVDK